MTQTFNPERNKLLASIKHLLMMLDDNDRPARFCRREIKRLCKRLTRLNILSR